MDVPYISAEEVSSLLKPSLLLPVIEEALKDFSIKNGIEQPLRVTVPVSKHGGFLGTMPAYNANTGALACKLVSFYPGNATKNQPTHTATIMLFDDVTGAPKAILDGEVITARRTAAASLIATKYLSPEVHVLAVLGSGVQARSHIEAFVEFFPIREVRIWNHRPEGAKKLAAELGSGSFVVRACEQVSECVAQADCIVLATFSEQPVLHKEHLSFLKLNVHINAVGAPRPNWREMDETITQDSTIYADSRLSAESEAGDIIINKAVVYAEIGEVIAGRAEALTEQRTVFKSLGMAIEDAVSAHLVFELYQRNRV